MAAYSRVEDWQTPRHPSHLIDREAELTGVRALLLRDGVRLLTLTGPAGVGKTCLAREVSERVRSHFSQGVVFVDLASIQDPEAALIAVGESLGFPDLDREVVLERLETYLAEREVLLVLDSLDRVLSVGPSLADLLAADPGVRILGTSREAFRLHREQVYQVKPLPVPDPQHLPPLNELAQIPSVALFLQRARAIDPDFVLTDDDAGTIAQLCVHLDGLPLAIELAAAVTSVLSPRMILDRVGRRLPLLRWEARDVPARHRSLQSAIDFSYELLSSEDQVCFRRLGIFAGNFSLRAAAAILERSEADTIQHLTSLVNKSLVQVQVHGGDEDNVRYRLLETIQEYALERLEEAGEVERVAGTHARYYLDLAERAEPRLFEREQRIWFLRLEWAHENIRAAFRRLLESDEGELALRMAAALGYFWEARGYFAEGTRQLEKALTVASGADTLLRARALSRLGRVLTWSAPSVERPHAVLTEALELARSAGDRLILAQSLAYLGALGLFTGQWDESLDYLEQAKTLYEETRQSWGIGFCLLYLGASEFRRGRRADGVQLLEESLRVYRGIGDGPARGVALAWLAYTAEEPSDVPTAIGYLDELLGLSVETRDRRLLYLCGAGTGWLLRQEADPTVLARLIGAVRQVREMMGIDRGRIFTRMRC